MVQSRFVTVFVCAAACAAAVSGAPDASRTGSDNAVKPAATKLTTEQRAALRAELAKLLNQSNESLASIARADGTLAIELEGRHAHAMIARPRAGGRPELACFDDPDAAVSYLARDERRAEPAPAGTRNPQPEERDR